MKKKLITLLSAGILSGCVALNNSSIEGEMSMAFVPERIDDIPRKNEGKLGLKVDYLLPVNKSTFFAGTEIIGYGRITNPFWKGVKANKFIGEAHLGYRLGPFEFYISHLSAHPFESETKRVYQYIDDQGEIQFQKNYPHFSPDTPILHRINEYDYKTEIGIKLKFSGKFGK